MKIIRVLPVLVVCLLAALNSDAALTPLGPNNFAPGTITVDFSGIADNTEVNGLVVNNALFQVTNSGLPTNGLAIIGDGLGTTNNITPPNIVSSIFNFSGLALEVSLPSPVNQFGYGYAIFAFNPIPAATNIQLFSGLTPVGSIDFDGTPDPVFTGGFAGVSSTVAFDHAVLTFTTLTPAFAVDNVKFANAVSSVPDREWTWMLFAMAVTALLCSQLRRHKLIV